MNDITETLGEHNSPPQIAVLVNIWTASGYSLEELEQVIRSQVEAAFIAAVRPTPQQIAEWKATGTRCRGLSRHIINTTGLAITSETLECLWRYFTGEKQTRRKKVISDFLRSLSELHVCSQCGKPEGPFHVDHVVPIAKGGADSAKNLQVLCRHCNQTKGAKYDAKTPFVHLYQ